MTPPSAEQMSAWLAALRGSGGAPRLSLEQYLAGIPRLDALSDVPSGTPVLVRGDLDCKPGAEVGHGDERLESMRATLRFGRERGWKQVLFGHLGRKPEGSLKAVAARLEQLLGAKVPLVVDWLDEAKMSIRDEAAAAVADSPAGGFVLLENARKYEIERLLWDAAAEEVREAAGPMARLAASFRERIARVYVNEAFSAGSLDASSTVVPAAMDRVALGRYVAGEFDTVLRCRRASLVVFSGLKTDKLDDMQAMIDRGTVRMVFTAGSLAMALKKANAQLSGGDFHLGLAEDSAAADKPFHIPGERIDQARRMLAEAGDKKIEFVLPVDFILADGSESETIGPRRQQFDVGPKTRDLFSRKVDEFIVANPVNPGGPPAVVFYNGVFGMFEDPRFEEGTRRFISDLKRMKDAGLEVYVGGGEGGAALAKYGRPDWVTHCFTAGGTVLNALGNQPVPYLQALYLAANR